ncbi:hypothetical protein AMJ39_01670 [candidate division TA06 bacterium DG_24]|uniref:Probable endolytic peptidoglycan transglycosylase RlpA n=2 Tax=Bacteria division TA06 TaxID=1156500 RepID=A0A0S8GIE3_UNCT6|nr:MAG: hypothetical protein AMJ39_01670 [candidate division TA06 bacterium DG_24]KPK71581.1 MAG: hypothetical protein AMJ82_00395 [candidate division TA06 bacterium SM23_40]
MNRERRTARRGASRALVILCIIGLVAAGCATTERYRSGGRVFKGYATYYGRQYHGRATASGEIFDMYAMTAAHRTLPFGTRVRVTNCANGRSVVVRINDRGPFVQGVIIDLSFGAAQRIGLLGKGIVRLEVLP